MRPRAPRQPSTSAADQVRRLLAEGVRHHQQGRAERAAACYHRALRLDPGQPDALHLLGLVRHGQGEAAEAERLIRQAIALAPDTAAFYNALGVVLLGQGKPAAAAEAFAAALARDPLLADAHNNLGNACQALGRLDDAVDAYERALALRPGFAGARVNRGRALHRLGRMPEAAAELRRAIALEPAHARAHRYLGDVLGEQGDRAGAEAAYRQAIALDPGDADAHAGLAGLLERAGALEQALALAEQGLERAPTGIRAAVVAARCLRRLGRPADGLRHLERVDAGHADADLRSAVAFEIGAICDRLGDYARAYAAYAEGNARLLETPAAAAVDRTFFPRLIERLAARFTADWLASWTPSPPDERPAPCFLIGFPRSGTTLLDQILDAHPDLTTLDEKDALDAVRRAVDRLPQGYPEALATLDPDHVRRLRDLYWREVERHLGGAPAGRLIDKMPLNTIDAGLIFRLFPEARLIVALRHPCDVVLSGFMQAFRLNDAMIHFATLADTARFYAQVMALWRQYRALLPLAVVDVRYEDLVRDLEGEARRLLAFLGVPWDAGVLAYADHAKGRTIATPSYHQVVQPIYARSVGRWRHYREPLTAVLRLLAPSLEAFGYSVED